MSQYDIALGMNAVALNKALGQLYNKQAARDKFFKGFVSGEISGHKYDLNWDMCWVPELVLGAPAPADWKAAVGADGQPIQEALPDGQLFAVKFPVINLGGSRETCITGLVLYADIAVRADANALCIRPLAMNEAGSNLSGLDKILFNTLVLPGLFRVVGNATKKLELPALSQNIFGETVTFCKPVVAIANKQLILATSKAGGVLDISGAIWPGEKPVFILAKPEFIISTVKPKLEEEVKKLKKSDSGKNKGVSWNYSAAVSELSSIKFVDTPTPTPCIQATAKVTFSGKATVAGGICAASAATK